MVDPPAAALLDVAVGAAPAVVEETKTVVGAGAGAGTEFTGAPGLQRSLNQDCSCPWSPDEHAGHTAEGLEGS